MEKDTAFSNFLYINRIEPFLRWAGGKQSTIKHLLNFLPKNILDLDYIEPFLGAGSLFFSLQPQKAILSDFNNHLIDCFIYVRDYHELVASYLLEHKINNSLEYYYKIRNDYNSSEPSAEQAARFIYLNKACFNGIFRVNQKGKFNVPYGKKDPPFLPDLEWLRLASNSLKKAIIKCNDFDKILNNVTLGNFIYFDPPYPPLNHTSNFTHYTKDKFNLKDQYRLSETFHYLNNRGCLVMMSNADIPLIRKLYKDYNLHSLPVRRYITCKSVKHQVSELIIRNYSE
jgi:DNA adenine methylase